MDNRSGTPRSQRQQRVGELIRHAVADVLLRGEIRDPVISEISITVTEVTVSPDLKTALAWVMPLGGKSMEEVEEALNRCASYIRGQVSHAVSLKFTPRLKFKIDQSFDQADEIATLLNRPSVRRDLTDGDDRDEGGLPTGS
ncbi:MAG: 30S ribosome-binding factor RbfA [Alphaproteobacteria bacterium]|nr:MAG: 30S ribosome-binding factor RbfA [Alphaproteobacteria bacterium]